MERIGIVGYGGMGSYHHALIKDFGKLDACAVMDIDERALQKAKENGISTATKDFAEFLRAVDIVLVATPNDLHCDYVVRSLNAGKHVICEKPAAMNVLEYEKMESAAKKVNRILCVHQNRRWDLDFLTVKKTIESGVLGRIYKIQSAVMAANGIPGDWRKLKENGGGMVLDWGVHLIDQAFLLSDFTEWDGTLSFVFGHEVDDGFNLNLRREGLVYNIIVDTNAFIPEPRWLVFGTEGTLVINDWDISGKIVRIKGKSNPKAITAGNGLTKTMAEREKTSVEVLEIEKAEIQPHPFLNQFMQAIRTGEQTVKHGEVKKVLSVIQDVLKNSKRLD